MATKRVFYYERFGIISVANVSPRNLLGVDMRSGKSVDLSIYSHWKTPEQQKQFEQQGRIRPRNGTLHREPY